MSIADGIVLAVTVVWIGSVVAALVNPSLRDPQIHLIFGAIVGGYLTTKAKGDGK